MKTREAGMENNYKNRYVSEKYPDLSNIYIYQKFSK